MKAKNTIKQELIKRRHSTVMAKLYIVDEVPCCEVVLDWNRISIAYSGFNSKKHKQ